MNNQVINFQVPPNIFKPYYNLFVLEVIKTGIKMFGNIAVITNHQYVSPRYIFAWDRNVPAPNQNIDLKLLEKMYYQTLTKLQSENQSLIKERIKKLS